MKQYVSKLKIQILKSRMRYVKGCIEEYTSMRDESVDLLNRLQTKYDTLTNKGRKDTPNANKT